jgi:hypothetical protein
VGLDPKLRFTGAIITADIKRMFPEYCAN